MEPNGSIMCLVCQEYGDHLTSKCPYNRCKSCGISGHVNKDCLTKDLLNINKYLTQPNLTNAVQQPSPSGMEKCKYSSSEPEAVFKPPLDNIKRMQITYENELEDTIPLLLKPLKRETTPAVDNSNNEEKIKQFYSSKNTEPEEDVIIIDGDHDGHHIDSQYSVPSTNKTENVEEMLRLARKALEKSDRLNKETEKRARESERLNKETKILKRKMKYENSVKTKILKPSTSTTSLLIKIKNTSRTTSSDNVTTKKTQQKMQSTSELLRENLKNAYDNDMHFLDFRAEVRRLIASSAESSWW
jgi:hypothetical protein